MYFEDLTEYSYLLNKPCPKMLNIGWLDQDKDFSTGKYDEKWLNKFKEIVVGNQSLDVHMNRIRGVVPCRLCGESNIEITNSVGVHRKLGMSEMLIPYGGRDLFYVLPAIVVHYIESHMYRAPEEFIRAVEQFDLDCRFNAQDVFDELVD